MVRERRGLNAGRKRPRQEFLRQLEAAPRGPPDNPPNITSGVSPRNVPINPPGLPGDPQSTSNVPQRAMQGISGSFLSDSTLETPTNAQQNAPARQMTCFPGAQDTRPQPWPRHIWSEILACDVDDTLNKHERCCPDGYTSNHTCRLDVQHPGRLKYYRQGNPILERAHEIAHLYEIARVNREATTLVKRRIKYYLRALDRRIDAIPLHKGQRVSAPRLRLVYIRHCVAGIDLPDPLHAGPYTPPPPMLPESVRCRILTHQIDSALHKHEEVTHNSFLVEQDCWDFVTAKRAATFVARYLNRSESGAQSGAQHMRRLYEIGRINRQMADLVRQRVATYRRDLDRRIKEARTAVDAWNNAHGRVSAASNVYWRMTQLQNVQKCLDRFELLQPQPCDLPISSALVLPREVRWRIVQPYIDEALSKHEGLESADPPRHDECWERVRATRRLASLLHADPQYSYVRRLYTVGCMNREHAYLVRESIRRWRDRADARIKEYRRQLDAREIGRGVLGDKSRHLRYAMQCLDRMQLPESLTSPPAPASPPAA
ncbi:MAG: hypothetical protein Q9162_007548 [Coniocarpon cinnabarinum]